MKDLNSALINSIYCKNDRKLGKAIKKGADVNRLDEFGSTPLMNAIIAEYADIKIVKMLIGNGADVNAKDTVQCWTPLHFAVREGHFDIVKLLLESGAVIDAQDAFGNTPLIEAVMSFKGDPQIIEILLAYGADKNIKNKEGVSPLILAETIGDQAIFKLLLKD